MPFRVAGRIFQTREAAAQFVQFVQIEEFEQGPPVTYTLTVPECLGATAYEFDDEADLTLEQAVTRAVLMGTCEVNIIALDDDDREIARFDPEEPEKGWTSD